MRNKNGLPGITPHDVFLTNGAMHALYVTFGALLGEGDEAIIPDPMWTEVAENIRLAGGVTVGVRLSAEEGFAYRAADIAAAITPKTTLSGTDIAAVSSVSFIDDTESGSFIASM